MFWVFNKEKICAYIVSVITVCFLFFIANSAMPSTVETSVNTTNSQSNTNMNNTVK